MKRSVAALVSLVLAAGGVAAGTLPASAAPPTEPWGALAGGSAAALTFTAGPVTVAGAGVVNAASLTGSQVEPRSTSVASNAAADLAGAGIVLQANSLSAPPDAGPVEAPLADVETGIVDLTALTTRNEAHWAGDGQCTVGEPLASTTASAGSVGVLGGLAALQNVTTTGTTVLEATGVGSQYAVVGTATDVLDGVTLLGGRVRIDVSGTTTLTARSNGVDAGTVDYDPATVTVTDTETNTAVELGGDIRETTVTVDEDTSATVRLNDPVIVADGTDVAATSSLFSIAIGDGLVTATLDVLQLAVSASAPAGGLDCTLPAPGILVPVADATLTDTTPTISGTGLPGATVTVSVDGTPVGTATVTEAGTFSLDSTTLATGPHSATATQTLGELSSPASVPVPFRIQAGQPAPPVITAPEDGDTTPARPAISGTALAGASVEVFVDDASIGTTTATAAGTFTLTPTADIAAGDHVVTARQTDAGGTSLPSNAVDITVVAAPAQPVITAPANGSSTNDRTPDAVVQTEPNATVEFVLDGEPVGTATADTTGRAVLTLPSLGDGGHTLGATASNETGRSVPAAPVSFTVDTVAPPAPVITAPAPGSTTGPKPPVSGTSEPGTTVTIIIDGTPAGTGTTGGDGTFTITPTRPLGAGDHTVTAIATDAAGNASGPSRAVTFRVSASLAATGLDGAGLAPAGAVLLIAMGATLLIAVRRRLRPTR